MSLAAIQRLSPRIGYAAAWTGSGPALARTADGGVSWQGIAVPATPLTALRFIDAQVGWAAGMIPRPMAGVACEQAPPYPMDPCFGVVLKTENGGATWRRSLLIPYEGVYPYPVQQIQAIDAQTAWALIQDCGPNPMPAGTFACPSELKRTADGGRTWVRQTMGYIASVQFATPSRGWLAAGNSDGTYDIKATSDGGFTWKTELRTTSGQVVGLDAADSLTAWVMTQDGGYCTATTCERYELFRTTDGGVSWSSVGNPKTSAGGACWGGHLAGPVFAGRTKGWLAENTGAGGAKASTGLLSSDDGGKTWGCHSSPAGGYVVSAADAQHVWVMTNQPGDGASSIFSSDDGGLSWHRLSPVGLA